MKKHKACPGLDPGAKIMRKDYFIFYLLLVFLSSCSPKIYQASFIESHPRVDTKDRVIDYQTKRVYTFPEMGVRLDNMFDGARLNHCWKVDENTIGVRISPENTPINASPWYAMRVLSTSNEQGEINIQIQYEHAKHRYPPRVSYDRFNWKKLNPKDYSLSHGDSMLTLQLTLNHDTTWLAAQEIMNSSDNLEWLIKIANQTKTEVETYGKSELGRDLYYLDIGKKNKPILVITGRQHPPEITGYLGMQAFVEKLLDGSAKSKEFLKNYRVLLYPMTNPDGVDLGNWRHTSGGIDLNRDWGSYHQAETKLLCDHIVTQSRKFRNPVVLGIDFHSTQNDIIYTNSVEAPIQDACLALWNSALEGIYTPVEPSGTRPVATSKTWFYEELGAEGIIYEVGDQTERTTIKEKAELAAQFMIQVLLAKK